MMCSSRQEVTTSKRYAMGVVLVMCLTSGSVFGATSADDLIGNIKGLVGKTKKAKAGAATSDNNQTTSQPSETNAAQQAQPDATSNQPRFDVKGLSLGQSVAESKQKVGGVCKDDTPAEGIQYHYLILDCSDPNATLAEKPVQSQTLYFVDDKLVRSVSVVFLLRNDYLRNKVLRYDSGDVVAEQNSFLKVLSSKYGAPLGMADYQSAQINKLTPFKDVMGAWKNKASDDVLIAAPTANDTKSGRDHFVLLELTSKDGVEKLVAIKKAADQQSEAAQRKQEQETTSRKARDL